MPTTLTMGEDEWPFPAGVGRWRDEQPTGETAAVQARPKRWYDLALGLFVVFLVLGILGGAVYGVYSAGAWALGGLTHTDGSKVSKATPASDHSLSDALQQMQTEQQQQTPDECIVLSNGNELCGETAAAWCNGNARATGSISACRSIWSRYEP